MCARRTQRLMSNQIIIRKTKRGGERARLWIQDVQVGLWNNSEGSFFHWLTPRCAGWNILIFQSTWLKVPMHSTHYLHTFKRKSAGMKNKVFLRGKGKEKDQKESNNLVRQACNFSSFTISFAVLRSPSVTSQQGVCSLSQILENVI